MNKEQLDRTFFYAVLFFYAAMDGWRDAWLNHGWIERHTIKWIAFYSLPMYVLWKGGFLKIENWKSLIFLADGQGVYGSMTSKNTNIWQWIAAGLASIVIAIGGYFVNQIDSRLEEYDRRIAEFEIYKFAHAELTRDQILTIETRFARIEEKIDSMNTKRR